VPQSEAEVADHFRSRFRKCGCLVLEFELSEPLFHLHL